MYESLLHIDKSCIFRETFNSAFDVANNRYARGVVSATGVKFDNGVAKLDGISGYLNYPKFKLRSNTITIVFNLREVVLGDYYLFDNTNRAYIYYGADGHVEGPSTVYVNGTLGYLPGTVNSSTRQIVGVFSSIKDIRNVVIGKHYSAPIYSKLNIESIEIYNRVLSASEIKLLYQNQLYVKPSNLPLLLDFDSTRGVIEDRTGLNTLTATNVEIKQVGKVYSSYLNRTNSSLYVNENNINITTSSDLIFSFWATKGIVSGGMYVSKQGSSGAYWCMYYSGSGLLMAMVDSTGKDGTVTGILVPMVNNTLYHILFRISIIDRFAVSYVNGKTNMIKTSIRADMGSLENTAKLKIGSRDMVGNENRLKGYIPKLQIINSVGFSDNQVDLLASQLYNSQKSQFNL